MLIIAISVEFSQASWIENFLNNPKLSPESSWHKGIKGQSCNQVCASQGLTCVQENWDDANCEFCKSFYPNAVCSTLSNDYAPAYNTVYPKCLKRGSAISQNCSKPAGAYERICLCGGQAAAQPEITQPTSASACTDSDHLTNVGFYNTDKFTPGNVTSSGVIYRDICYSSVQLKESYCLANKNQSYSSPLLCGTGYN